MRFKLFEHQPTSADLLADTELNARTSIHRWDGAISLQVLFGNERVGERFETTHETFALSSRFPLSNYLSRPMTF